MRFFQNSLSAFLKQLECKDGASFNV